MISAFFNLRWSSLTFCMMLASFLSQAAAATSLMTVKDLVRVREVVELAVSPLSGAVVQVVTVPRNVLDGEPDGGVKTRLYLSQTADINRLLPTARMSPRHVKWRPGSNAITFLGKRDQDKTVSLYEIASDLKDPVRAFRFGSDINAYVWSADGKELFFTARATPKAGDDTSTTIKFPGLLFEENLQFLKLWQVDLSANQPVPKEIRLEGHIDGLKMSEDGSVLAVKVSKTPLIDDRLVAQHIQTIRVKDLQNLAKFTPPGKIGDFDVSPDGRILAFVGAHQATNISASVLHLANVATGQFKSINPDAEYDVRVLQWMTNGKLAAVVNRGVETDLATLDQDGNIVKRFQRVGLITKHISTFIDGDRIALSASTANHPSEVFVIDGSGEAVRWSHHNSWLANRALAFQDTLRYKARDGQSIEAVRLTPAGKPPKEGWPLVILVHGGPESHHSNGWLTTFIDPGQILAAKGYMVIYPNYRGSTGRGIAFTALHQTNHAEGEFNDLVDAIDSLARQSIVDPKRVGIAGLSYGGYAASWGATALSDRFSVAVSAAGIANQTTLVMSSDIPNEYRQVHYLKWPWEERQKLLEASPIHHVQSAQTPLLLLHGEVDKRVRLAQSLQLYRYMKARSDAPVRLVTYPGEGHVPKRAAAQLDFSMRLVRWLDHYLSGKDEMPPDTPIIFK
ncbi:MAG: S9 family peptidase [Pseudomonadota bacterium]